MDSLQTYEPKSKDILGAFETRLEDEHRRRMREELAERIALLDEEAFTAASRECPQCGETMYGHGRCGARSYLASCGEVTVRLRRIRCRGCGHIAVPGASLVPKNGISACLGEKMCDMASRMPFAKATESLRIQHGIHMSPKRYWTFVQNEAGAIGDMVAEEADALYEDGVEPEAVDLLGEKPLIIGIDGGHVRGWKANPSFEVKCATLATGTEPSSPKRRRLTDRVGYAAECSVEEFRRRVSTLAIKSGYLTAGARIFVSDGATWISKMIADWFPDAIHVLDMYHLKHKVTALFGIRAEGEAAMLRDKALAACGSYEPRLLMDVILSWCPTDSAKAEEQSELAGYVSNNSEAIGNHRLVSVHGSGWIEKGVDLMVSRRLKNRGMSWTVQGCSHMVPFAVLRYNSQWDAYWDKRKGLDHAAA